MRTNRLPLKSAKPLVQSLGAHLPKHIETGLDEDESESR